MIEPRKQSAYFQTINITSDEKHALLLDNRHLIKEIYRGILKNKEFDVKIMNNGGNLLEEIAMYNNYNLIMINSDIFNKLVAGGNTRALLKEIRGARKETEVLVYKPSHIIEYDQIILPSDLENFKMIEFIRNL